LAEIENCNNGANPTIPVAEGGCPYYHQYRSSGDINNGYPSWVANAQTVARCVTGSFLFFAILFLEFCSGSARAIRWRSRPSSWEGASLRSAISPPSEAVGGVK
jgi:hypothetical protein